MAPTPDWHPPTPASTGGGAGAGDQLFRDDLRARMLEILASKDHADHELSKLAKFIEEKNSGLAVPPSSSFANAGAQDPSELSRQERRRARRQRRAAAAAAAVATPSDHRPPPPDNSRYGH